jgi:hypothetical protein
MQRIVAHLHAHASMSMRPADNAVELLAAGMVHGVNSRHLERRKRRDGSDHLVGDPRGAELTASVHGRAQLELIRLLDVGHARSR